MLIKTQEWEIIENILFKNTGWCGQKRTNHTKVKNNLHTYVTMQNGGTEVLENRYNLS